jgi:transmembrane sensor
MKQPKDRTDALLLEAAAHVVSAEMNVADVQAQTATLAWRNADSSHEAAYRQVTDVWEAAGNRSLQQELSGLKGKPTLRERSVRFLEGSREYLGATFQQHKLAGAMTAMALVVGTSIIGVHDARAPDYQTQIAQISRLALPDGSVVTLGPASSVKLDFSGRSREVTLIKGEAFFEVLHDETRPFVVQANGTSIQDVGTKFNVNVGDGHARIAVLEGAVQISSVSRKVSSAEGAEKTPLVIVRAGQEAIDHAGSSRPIIEAVPTTSPGAWRDGRLSFQNATLTQIIADANRYRDQPIRIASPSLANERLTTSFKASQIDQLLSTLSEALPIAVQRNSDGTVDLKTQS